jgi:hypothetical protein
MQFKGRKIINPIGKKVSRKKIGKIFSKILVNKAAFLKN